MPAGVTTLYFEAEREDDLRQAGYSKERRVDPQSIVGLLVDRHGFPPPGLLLEEQPGRDYRDHPRRGGLPGCSRHEELVIVADAGMLSASNERVQWFVNPCGGTGTDGCNR